MIKALGFSRACIYNWLARYRGGGWPALRSGKQSGRPKKLTGSHICWIYNTVKDKDPQQMKLPFTLWTLGMVAEEVKKKFAIKLSLSSVKPPFAAIRIFSAEAAAPSLPTEPGGGCRMEGHGFSRDQKRAKKLGAKIYFVDESGVPSDYHSGRIWAPMGETPVVESTGGRFSANRITAIDTRRNMRFMTTKGSVDSQKVCEFLKKLMHDNEGLYF